MSDFPLSAMLDLRPLRHIRRQRLATVRRHGESKLGPPPQDVVGKARPFLAHEVTHLGLGQLRSKSPAERLAARGIAQYIGDPRAVGTDQPQRLPLVEK